MRYLLGMLAAALLVVAGCNGLPAVEVCYNHPKYGQVCVSVGGKKYLRGDLSPAEKAEVEAWLKAQGAQP